MLRGGYGLYWAPCNYPAPSPTSNNGNFGQIGFTNNTSSPQPAGTAIPTVTLANPFPNGVVPASGSSLGLLAGAGTSIAFVDQNRGAPRVQQFSVDLQRELGGDMAFTVSYVGARGDHLPLGGTVDTPVNINQLDPKYLALGAAALSAQVPNPFFGIAAAGPFSRQANIARSQLLRPFPQYGDINMLQVTEGYNRYNAAVFELNKRLSHGWGGRFSYTYSVLKDNQMGETNFYSNRGNTTPVNNYNFMSVANSGSAAAACQSGQQNTTRVLRPDVGVLVRHSRRAAPVHRRADLPAAVRQGPQDRQERHWQRVGRRMDDRGGVQLPERVPDRRLAEQLGHQPAGQRAAAQLTGTPVGCDGDLAACLGSADHPTAKWLSDSVHHRGAGRNVRQRTAHDTDVRTPRIINTDLSVSKNFNFSGGKSAQIKIEIVNLFNRVQLNGLSTTTQGNSAFGVINSQSGFMRMTQLMFRFSF